MDVAQISEKKFGRYKSYSPSKKFHKKLVGFVKYNLSEKSIMLCHNMFVGEGGGRERKREIGKDEEKWGE